MVKMMKLSLDDLAVESFATAAGGPGRGTVYAREDSEYTEHTCHGYATCDASCDASCETCVETCGAVVTCDGTCGFSCAPSCYATCRAYRTECMAPF